jgi:hypothetical protein
VIPPEDPVFAIVAAGHGALLGAVAGEIGERHAARTRLRMIHRRDDVRSDLAGIEGFSPAIGDRA